MLEYMQLPVRTIVIERDRKRMQIFIGQKRVTTLQWSEPVLPGSEPRWWLEVGSDIECVGFSDEEAVYTTLRKLGYV